MVKKNSKSKKSHEKSRHRGFFITTIILSVFLVFSLALNGLMLWRDSAGIEARKADVFDNLAFNYVANLDLTDNSIKEAYTMTGYGISDEDNVFYITFKYADYSKCVDVDCDIDVKYGVIYYWPSEHGPTGYSNAYSYHTEPYHPGGEYVEFGF